MDLSSITGSSLPTSQPSTSSVSVPLYHCPKCRSGGEQAVFSSLPELRQHVLKNHFGHDIPEPARLSGSGIKASDVSPLFLNRDYLNGGKNMQSLSDPEQLAQVKRYLLMEAMKTSEQSREQIKQLNEEIRNKENHLGTTEKKLSSLAEKNQTMEEEFGRMQEQNREIRRELEELRNKLLEKEKLLEDKNKQLTDQLNYVKSIEEKEIVAKEKLEKSVQKIIERAETAEKNLELMKQEAAVSRPQTEIASRSNQLLSSQQPPYSTPNDYDSIHKNVELQNILESCNTASNAAYTQSTNPDLLARMLTPLDPKQTTTPLAQIYLKNFLERYNELKARDFAYNQTFVPMMSNQQQPQQPNYNAPYYPLPQQQPYQQSQYGMPTQPGSSFTDPPETDGSKIKPRKKIDGNQGNRNRDRLDEAEEDQTNTNNNNSNMLYPAPQRRGYTSNAFNYSNPEIGNDYYYRNESSSNSRNRPKYKRANKFRDEIIDEVDSEIEDSMQHTSISPRPRR